MKVLKLHGISENFVAMNIWEFIDLLDTLLMLCSWKFLGLSYCCDWFLLLGWFWVCYLGLLLLC